MEDVVAVDPIDGYYQQHQHQQHQSHPQHDFTEEESAAFKQVETAFWWELIGGWEAGLMASGTSEDCLHLNVWAPLDENRRTIAPRLVFKKK